MGVGLDNIDVAEATRRGVSVTNVPDYCVEEVSDHAVLDLFEPRADHPLLRLVSLMDHTPGDRQFRDPSRFRRHREKTNGRRWSDE